MKYHAILLDVGEVLIDQHQRAQQWPQLVGDAFTAQLGGTGRAWSEAHRVTTQQLDQTFANASASGDFRDFLRSYHLAWI